MVCREPTCRGSTSKRCHKGFAPYELACCSTKRLQWFENMANFSDILTKKFRWPTAGDRLFDVSAKPRDNARLVSDQFARMVIMASGYKEGADTMVQAALDQGNTRDFLIYPTVVCYPQYLELTLKWMLWTYGSAVRVEANWKSHDLDTLWKEFEKILSRFGANRDDDGTDNAVAECVREFSEIDEASFNFRYSMKRHGPPIALTNKLADYTRLRDV